MTAAACNNVNGIADTDDRTDILNVPAKNQVDICEYTEGYGDLPGCQPCSTQLVLLTQYRNKLCICYF